jgi:hypothetical protein
MNFFQNGGLKLKLLSKNFTERVTSSHPLSISRQSTIHILPIIFWL